MKTFFKKNRISFIIVMFLMIAVLKESHAQTPSRKPTMKPSRKPSRTPTLVPTLISTEPTSQPSSQPTSQPTGTPTSEPSSAPSNSPTNQPVGIKPVKSVMPTTHTQNSNDSVVKVQVYTPGHVAGAVIGSFTLAIWVLLCIYSGRNRRAFKRDMKTFYGAQGVHILDKASTSAALKHGSASNSATGGNNKSSGYRNANAEDEVYNPMI